MSNIAKIRKIRDKIEAEVVKADDRPELLDSTQVLAMKFMSLAKKKDFAGVLNTLKQTIVISYMNGKRVRVKTDEGYYIWIPNEMNFEAICPYCGEELSLDLKDMIRADEIIEGMLDG